MKQEWYSNLWWLIKFTVWIWVVHFINQLFNGALFIFGLQPRTLWGLVGIITSPMIHENYKHILANTTIFIVVGLIIQAMDGTNLKKATAFIWICESSYIWIWGRDGMHAGLSGVVFGYLGFAIIRGFRVGSILSVFLSIAVLYLYGTVIQENIGNFQQNLNVSWEGHVSGFIAGLVTAIILPRSAEKK